jgi:hypothetical protein
LLTFFGNHRKMLTSASTDAIGNAPSPLSLSAPWKRSSSITQLSFQEPGADMTLHDLPCPLDLPSAADRRDMVREDRRGRHLDFIFTLHPQQHGLSRQWFLVASER